MAMMRTMFLLAGMFTVTAADTPAQCVFDGAKAVSQLSDAVVYLWAASKRCSSTTGNPKAPQCPMDIADAAEAVSDMVMVIVKAVNDCTTIHSESYECGMAVGGMISASAGLTAGTAGIFKDCPTNPTTVTAPFPNELSSTGKCLVDAKGTVTNLFQAVLQLSKVSKDCEAGTNQCAINALSIIGAVAKMGAGIAGTVNDCQIMADPTKTGNKDARCVKAVSKVVAGLSHIGVAGTKIAQKCTVSTQRLYELEAAETGAPQNSMVLMLAACIPLAAVLSFVVGARFAKRRTERRTQTLSAHDEADETLI
jgi:hypothetical protein